MVFRPSTFFIVVHTNYGIDLEVQLTPIMQLYIKACDTNKGTLRGGMTVAFVWVLSFKVINTAARVKLLLHPGLCGDFNDVEGDDFRTTSGLIEGTASIFASTWKMDPNCVDVKTTEDPCTMSIVKSPSPNWLSRRALPPHTAAHVFPVCLFLQTATPGTGAACCQTRRASSPGVTLTSTPKTMKA